MAYFSLPRLEPPRLSSPIVDFFPPSLPRDLLPPFGTPLLISPFLPRAFVARLHSPSIFVEEHGVVPKRCPATFADPKFPCRSLSSGWPQDV